MANGPNIFQMLLVIRKETVAQLVVSHTEALVT